MLEVLEHLLITLGAPFEAAALLASAPAALPKSLPATGAIIGMAIPLADVPSAVPVIGKKVSEVPKLPEKLPCFINICLSSVLTFLPSTANIPAALLDNVVSDA